MKIGNIINFVKAGYTPAEIASMEKPDAVAALLQEGIKKEDIHTYLELIGDEPDPEESRPTPMETEDPTDYKEKYQALLKQTQDAAARENMKPEEKPTEEILAEIVKSFM